MTVMEATIIAFRELGLSEDEIAERFQIASDMVPGARGESDVRKGFERVFIEHLKTIHEYFSKDPKATSEFLDTIRTKIRKEYESN